MKTNQKIKTMVIAALLCGIGIAIPMFMPKVVLGPMSFTLASHVPVFLAVFISPPVAAVVSVITGFGFLMAGFPIVIVLRAFSHLGFALVGALLLKKRPETLCSVGGTLGLGALTAVIHAICEVFVVTAFFFSGAMGEASYQQGYWYTVFFMVGVGTLIHSSVDYSISVFVWKHVQNVIHIPVCARVKPLASGSSGETC